MFIFQTSKMIKIMILHDEDILIFFGFKMIVLGDKWPRSDDYVTDTIYLHW